MPTVEVYNGNLENALAVFKGKVEQERVVSEYKRRLAFIPAHEEREWKAFRARCKRKERRERAGR